MLERLSRFGRPTMVERMSIFDWVIKREPSPETPDCIRLGRGSPRTGGSSQRDWDRFWIRSAGSIGAITFKNGAKSRLTSSPFKRGNTCSLSRWELAVFTRWS